MVQIEGLDKLMREHPFFEGMSASYRELVAGCAANEVFQGGTYVYKEGQPADKFYLIRRGRVALEVHVPGRSPIIVETLKTGDLMGWSWLVPPYRASFDARALELTRLISLDAACLRGKMDHDPVLGYELHKRFAPVVAARLAAARHQLIDMYGHPED
ncbi:MAG: cyclic nucleotide-binding domain-containing protein [Rhodospirillales bacterium]